ncbi:MAG TPA: allophanate hydrolase [Chthoniobacterales bacterium]|nr:allophanate hydrolase [Chthoniobacterales bacterium]
MIDLRKLTLEISLLRSGYRSGDFTPAEVIREIYRRIKERGEDHVWIHLRPETEVIAQAEAAASRLDLPLAGIPCAVKDNIDVAGLPTTAGCPAYASTPEVSASVVQALEDAGAIILGKTNMDQFATGLVGVRSPYGACASVYHPEFISGGSSSGSAVAVAAGLASFSLGTDTAGSGRVPAAFNNLVGLKPSRGIISTTGVVPACRSLDCVSIFAQNVEDAEKVLDLVVHEDHSDPYSRPFADRPVFSRPFRFGVPLPGQLDFCGDETAADLYGKAVARLIDLGGLPTAVDLTPFQKAASLLYDGPWVAERYAAVGKFIEAHEKDCDPTVAKIIQSGSKISASDTFDAIYKLEALRQQTAPLWKGIDFLLLPTTPTAYRIEDVIKDPVKLNSNLGLYTNFVNLLDLSALAVPAGFRPDGVPLGVTFIAPAFADFELCLIGRQFLGQMPSPTERRQRKALERAGGRIELAVVGAHLTGLPLNHQLLDRGAIYIETIETSPDYALFDLAGFNPPRPGLVCIGDNRGVAIETEIWSLSERAFGSFVAAVPPPMAIGNVRLKDGRRVKGFLCENYATHGAEPISAFGGWRNYLDYKADKHPVAAA